MKKITITLSPKSVGNAIKKLERYNKWVEEKTKLFTEKLALVGMREASIRFATAMYDGINDVEVSTHPYSVVATKGSGWVIEARGQAVAFLEYGAGVYHNAGEPYPNPRPEGIVGIGEYGKGRGKQRAWGFYNESGELVITRGVPATLAMWYAVQEMERAVQRIASEVFK